MKIRHSLLALALMSALPFCVAAQTPTDADMAKARADLKIAREQLRDASKRIAELSAKLGEGGPQAFAFRYLNEPNQAMVGIVMVPDANGVRIGAVTPGGPAAKAGVLAGDVLTAVDGKALATAAGKQPDEAALKPARELLSNLAQGQNVKLSVLREGKAMQFEVKAERRGSWDWAGMLGSMPDLADKLAPLARIHGGGGNEEVQIIINGERRAMPPMDMHGRGESRVFEFETDDGDGKQVQRIVREFRSGAPWASLNLSTLNPALGRYFGTSQGVLVLDSSETTLKELKPGDVIQIIDGEPADSVSGVMRALAHKEPGQTINVEVWRDRKRQVLTVTAPERDHFMFMAPPAPPAPPAAPGTRNAPPAPTPPAAPRAPSATAPATAPAPAPTPAPTPMAASAPVSGFAA